MRHESARRPGRHPFRHFQYPTAPLGTSESGFRAEVESEQALARGEHLLAMLDRHEHTELAGPASEEAARRLEEFAEHASFPGTVITDERRLARLMKRTDPAIYPDKYVTCVHSHASALCRQRRDSRLRLRPDLSSCQPLACRNVALTADNLTNLRQETQHIEEELAARPLLPPLLRHELHTRHQQITTFLDRHTCHGHA